MTATLLPCSQCSCNKNAFQSHSHRLHHQFPFRAVRLVSKQIGKWTQNINTRQAKIAKFSKQEVFLEVSVTQEFSIEVCLESKIMFFWHCFATRLYMRKALCFNSSEKVKNHCYNVSWQCLRDFIQSTLRAQVTASIDED